MTPVEVMRAKAAEITPLIGATMIENERDTWRAFAETPDGLSLIFAADGKAHKLTVYLPRPGHPGTSAHCGSIGVNLTRKAETVARDIERRLLVPARELAEKARAEWANLESHGQTLRALQAEFAAMPHCRVTLHSPDSAGQELKVNYYQQDVAGLSFTVGRCVTLERVHLLEPGSAAALDRVRAILAALQ